MTSLATAARCEMQPPIALGKLFRNGPKTGGIASWFPGSEIHFTYKGRTAIRHLCDLLDLRGSEVLMPAYNCGAEIEPLIRGGARIVPYRVDKSATVDIEDIRKLISDKTRAVHVTHYFGFPQPIDEIRKLCDRHRLFLIEDCALALFSAWQGRKLGSWGDVSIFSLPKSIPVPDGGVLVINSPRLQSWEWKKRSAPLLSATRRSLSLFKSSLFRKRPLNNHPDRIDSELQDGVPMEEWYSSPEVRGTDGLPDVPGWMHYEETFTDRTLSWFSAHLLRGVDEDEIIKTRRRNYLCLASLLSGKPGFTLLYKMLPPGVCPLGLPLVCHDRESLCRHLSMRGITAAIWWPGFDRNMDWDRFQEARFLKNHVLLLPAHQGLGEKDMEYIARAVATLNSQ
jgi:perosamine synthetase